MSSETVACRAFAVTLKSFSDGYWLVPLVLLLLQGCERGTGILVVMEPGVLPSAMMRTVAWR